MSVALKDSSVQCFPSLRVKFQITVKMVPFPGGINLWTAEFSYPSDAVACRKASRGLSGAHSQVMVSHPTTSCCCMFGCAPLRLSTLDNIKNSFSPDFRWEKSRAAVVTEVIGL